MANNKKAAASKAAAPKKVYFTTEDKSKYELKGKVFRFEGGKYTAEEAVKNTKLMEALIASGNPSIVKV